MATPNTTTIQIDTDRIKAFRAAVDVQGYQWRFKLNEIIDAYTRTVNQGSIKKMTRKAKGAL